MAAFLLAAGTVLSGCDLFGLNDPDPFIAKPQTLQPEIDAFADDSVRTYIWTESLRRDGDEDDSTLTTLYLEARSPGDTIIGDSLRPRLTLLPTFGNGSSNPPFSANSPAPSSVLTRLGFHPERVVFDQVGIPEAGPALPFPALPATGWRLDTTVGDIRFVRVLTRVQTIKQSGKRHETWAFAESTYVSGNSGVLLGSGTTWMGRNGLVRHRSTWLAFEPSTATAGFLYREIIAP
jgi:hypothetical protein